MIDERTIPDQAATVGVTHAGPDQTRRCTRLMVLVLLLFIGLGFTYSVVNPLFEATDELRHYRFVRYIAVHGRLPVQGQEPCRTQSHHPPLLYAAGALATGWIETGRDLCYTPPQNPFWAYRYFEVGIDNKSQYLHGPDEAFPWSGDALAAHIVRAINVLVGAGTVWLTWLIGRAVWPTRPALALGGAAFVAFNPMFLYMSGAINNDIIAAFSGTAVLLGAVRLLSDPRGLSRRWGLILGGLYGLALLSKFNLAPLALLIEVAVTLVAWRTRDRRGWLTTNLWIAAATLLLAGWWFLRNQLLYGEPTGFRILTELWGERDPSSSFGLAVSELPYAWSSLWGRFGFGQIPLPEAFYNGLAWLAGLALAGALLKGILGWWRSDAAGENERPALLLLWLDVAILAAVLFNYMLVSPAGPMGRFFFPALPALALLMFYGLNSWLEAMARLWRRRQPRRLAPARTGLAVVANLGMLAFSLVALFGYLAPAYARPPEWPAEASLPNPVNAQFDALVNLRGYEVSPQQVEPGEPIDITLYWEVTGQPPGDYLLFVHLVDETGVIIAQRDTHPGLGTFPSHLWQPGDRFVERLRLYVPETAYTPSTAALRVGLYAPGAYRLAVHDAAGRPLGDALTLTDAIRLRPWSGAHSPPAVENPLDQNFNNQIRLIGYAYNRRQLTAGEPLTVSLVWEAVDDAPAELVADIHLLDETGGVRASDAGPVGTSHWRAGEQHETTHQLLLPSDLPPGSYQVELLIRDPEGGERLPIVADDGHQVSHLLRLARVRVVP